MTVTGHSNPKRDQLLLAQRIENDPEKRNQMLCDIARLDNQDVLILYRGGRAFHVIANPQIKVFRISKTVLPSLREHGWIIRERQGGHLICKGALRPHDS